MSHHPPLPSGPRPGRFDVAVVGAGAVGLALAIALARAGLSVASVGRQAASQTGRTVALLDGSARLLAELGVWTALAGQAAPLRTLRIVDDTPSLFRAPPVAFASSSIGLPAFGYNVENDTLVEVLARSAAATPTIRRYATAALDRTVDRDGATLLLEDGGVLEAALIIAADGAQSTLRAKAGIGTREDAYPQIALTAVLHHTRPHGDISTEFHTRAGPFTLVPLRDEGSRHRSSLVWVMTPAAAEARLALAPAAFGAAVETQSRGLLGTIVPAGAIGRFPVRRVMAERLVGARLALAGEAAHALPPIGAQGLNLSFRDAATLVDIVVAAHRLGGDVGASAVLARYERARRSDIALRGGSVHALNMALLSSALPVDALRGAGLRLLAAVRPLREMVMREGLRPQSAVPALMRTPLPLA